MPLNSEYLSLLETFYGKFLKSENLDFRMDFDQAFKKLSPFMAFKTFSWILDWMTNDRSVSSVILLEYCMQDLILGGASVRHVDVFYFRLLMIFLILLLS